MSALYYEDVIVGSRFVVAPRTVTAQDIDLFATVSEDRHPIHTDDTYAAASPFKRRIAHGPFGIALAIGLFGKLPEFADTALAMIDLDSWKFLKPVFIGDKLSLELLITGKSLTQSGRAIIGRHMRLINQEEVVVQEGNSSLLIARRP